MTPELEKLLEDLVGAAPRECPDGPYCWCALTRAEYSKNGRIDFHTPLDRFAVSLGLTEKESYGVMNGWDEADGRRPALECRDGEPEYDRGYALGFRLFQKYGAKS